MTTQSRLLATLSKKTFANTLGKGEKMLVISIFSFCHNAFYPLTKYIFNQINFLVCKYFHFRRSKILPFSKELRVNAHFGGAIICEQSFIQFHYWVDYHWKHFFRDKPNPSTTRRKSPQNLLKLPLLPNLPILMTLDENAFESTARKNYVHRCRTPARLLPGHSIQSSSIWNFTIALLLHCLMELWGLGGI